MKILDIFHELLYDKDRLTITFPKSEREQIIKKLEILGSVDPEKEYDVNIKIHREKRSENANAYMWVLADKIAAKTRKYKTEVYRDAIRRVGVFEDVAVTGKATASLVSTWSDRGEGWFADVLESKLKGCKKVRLYFGSSGYDTKQRSRLIDDIVEEADELGIETKTPEQLARMKSQWKGADYE